MEATRTRAQDLTLALRRYLAGDEEAARLRAYDLAREAMAAGAGVLEIVADHRDALATLLSEVGPGRETTRMGEASAELLAESLSPFEMALRGFQEANASLLKVNADLKEQIAERHRAEREARLAGEEAERANRAKDEFLSRMSHELRTPLNAILGFGQLMEMDELEDGHREGVQQILRGGRHLLDLINEVLDIARIESGSMALSVEPILLAETVFGAMEMIQPLAVAQGIELVTTGAAWPADRFVLADRQRLRQVLLNLLSNAVKYNRPSGTVTLNSVQLDDRVRVEVRDEGSGVSPEMIDRLFVPFDRLGAEVTGIEGTGLGLALSKRLTEAMGGMLGVESTSEGSTFFFELPVVEVRPVEGEWAGVDHRATVRPTAVSATVLYVEDNTANVQLIERALKHRPDLRLLSAIQGSLGLDLARQHDPDLVLLDLHLPDMGGEEFLRLLRADPVTRAIPVIVVSADATPGRIRGLLAAGARAYLTKPLDMGRFYGVVDEVLAERRLGEAG